jgi:hypothetical protein
MESHRKDILDTKQNAIKGRSTLRVRKALLQGNRLVQQASPTTRFRQKRMNVRLISIDTVTYFINVRQQVELTRAQRRSSSYHRCRDNS